MVDLITTLYSLSRQWQNSFLNVKLNSTVVQTHTAETMAVLGVMIVQVKYREYVNSHELYVVEGV